jgi:hypothetical protein
VPPPGKNQPFLSLSKNHPFLSLFLSLFALRLTATNLSVCQCAPCAKEGQVVQRTCYAKCTDSCQDQCGRNVDPTTLEAFKAKDGFCPKSTEDAVPSAESRMTQPAQGGEQQ